MNTAPRALGALALAALLAGPIKAAEKPASNDLSIGYEAHVLTADDAAAVNAYLSPEYFPHHVSAGDVFATVAGGCLIDIPVVAPIPDANPPAVALIEILVPVSGEAPR